MIGEALVGVGALIILCMFAYIIYIASQALKSTCGVDIAKDRVYSKAIEKYAENKGINLVKERVRDKIVISKGFRQRLTEEVMEDFFGKEKENTIQTVSLKTKGKK